MKIEKTTYFVDCFSTIILRNIGVNQILKNWTNTIGQKFGIEAKKLQHLYRKYYTRLTFKNIFTHFMFEPDAKDIFYKMATHLTKYNISIEKFANDCFDEYFNAEAKSHYTNDLLVNFLKEEKNKGKKIYIVSDFFCHGDTISNWLSLLGIRDLFDGVFSSIDFKKEKATSRLYRELTKKLELNPREITMTGDNIWSDGLMARCNHLSSVHRIKEKKRVK